MHYIENDEKSSWKWWNDEKSFFQQCLQQCDDVRNVKATTEVSYSTKSLSFSARTWRSAAAPRTRKTIECTLLSWPKSATSVPAAFCVCTRPTFSHFVIMSVTVFKLGCTHLFFVCVKPGTKSTVPTIVPTIETNCWWRSYRQPPEASLMKLHL